MKRLLALILSGLFVVTAGTIQAACGHNPPILTPTAAAALTAGLSALHSVLAARGVSPLVLAAITDAQTAIANDVSGATWGQIVRDLVNQLYMQLPQDTLNQPAVWASFAALEVILATLGA